ncbi:hypothetical protein D3C81_1662200 [compost metagenome]
MTALVHNLAHPPLDHTHARTLKVVAQRPVKPLPIQQEFLVHVQVLAIPVHLPGSRHGRLAQRPTKACMPQALEYPLRNPFHCRETAPLRHHRHGVAKPPQADGGGSTCRAGAQYHNARFRHGWHPVAQGR